MEMLIALLLVAFSEKDEAFRDHMRRALAFYRENRELIALLAGAPANTRRPQEPDPSACTRSSENEKISPTQEGDSLGLIEEFLKKQRV